MKLTAQCCKQIHSRERLPLKQNSDVIPGHFQADGLIECDGARLMRRLLEHRSETEKLAFPRFIDDHFLMVFVHSGDPYLPCDHDVCLPAWVSSLVDAFARGESLELDLAGQHSSLVVVQQRKERNIFQH